MYQVTIFSISYNMSSNVVLLHSWSEAPFSLIGAYTTEISASVNFAILSVTKDNKRQFMSFSFHYKDLIYCVKPKEGCFYLHCCAWVHKVFKNLEATSKF